MKSTKLRRLAMPLLALALAMGIAPAIASGAEAEGGGASSAGSLMAAQGDAVLEAGESATSVDLSRVIVEAPTYFVGEDKPPAIILKVRNNRWGPGIPQWTELVEGQDYEITGYKNVVYQNEGGGQIEVVQDVESYAQLTPASSSAPGKGRAVIQAIGSNYTGKRTVEFSVASKNDLRFANLTLYTHAPFMTGEKNDPVRIATLAGVPLKYGEDFEVVYRKELQGQGYDTTYVESDPKDAGRYCFALVAGSNGEYFNSASDLWNEGSFGQYANGSFEIYDPKDLDHATVSVDEGASNANGLWTPTVIVTAGRAAISAENYTVTFNEYPDYDEIGAVVQPPLKGGDYQVTVTAKDGTGYRGSRYTTLSLEDANNLENASVTVSAGDGEQVDSYSNYRGFIVNASGKMTPAVSVELCGCTVDPKKYTVTYRAYAGDDDDGDPIVGEVAKAPLGPGSYIVTITPAAGSGLTGSRSTYDPFTIYARNDLSVASIETGVKTTSEGDAATYSVNHTVTLLDIELVGGQDYTLRYFKQVRSEKDGRVVISYDAIDGAPSEQGQYRVQALAKAGSAYIGENTGYFTLGSPSPVEPVAYTDLKDATVLTDTYNVGYTGSAAMPETIRVRMPSTYDAINYLEEGRDYTLSYQMNTEGSEIYRDLPEGELPTLVGRYRIIAKAVDGSGYTGTTESTYYGYFEIVNPYDLSKGYAETGEHLFELNADSAQAMKNAMSVFSAIGAQLNVNSDFVLRFLSDAYDEYDDELARGYVSEDSLTSGKYRVVAEGTGSYRGTQTSESMDLVDSDHLVKYATVTPGGPYTYTGRDLTRLIENSVVVELGGKVLEFGKDYYISFSNGPAETSGEPELNRYRSPYDTTQSSSTSMRASSSSFTAEPGTYTARICGYGDWEDGPYFGTKEFTFEVAAPDYNLQNAQIATIPAQTYTGSAIQPAIGVKAGTWTLTQDKHYTASYANNTNAGTATVTIQGIAPFEGKLTKTFAITPASIAKATVTAAKQTYGGKALKPAPTVKLGGKTLKAGADFTVKSYAKNTNAGTAEVVVAGTGNYAGTAKGTFAIAKLNIAKASIAKITDKAYTGKALKPAPKVTARVGGKAKVLSAKTDYTVKYAKNKAVGKATVTVVGKGNYTGKASRTFNIVKAKNPLAVKAAAKQVKYVNVKKKAQTVKGAVKITKKGQGKLSYAKVAKGSSKSLTINPKTGAITVKKGAKKTTHAIKVKVKAAGNASYKPATKTVTVKIRVK